MPSRADGNGLAARQAELVRALVAGGPAPAGLDADRVRVQARVLLAKRRRIIEAQRPDLVDALGARFAELADAWATAHARPANTTSHADAEAFAAWLAEYGHLPRVTPGRWYKRLRR